jgi:thiamine-phosphate pyrophosphorylase
MTLRREAPRLCLVFEPKPDSDTRSRFEMALAAASPASLILAPGPDVTLDAEAAKPLVALAQAMNVAVLVEADAQLALALGADGAHIPWSKDPIAAYAEAREILGTDRVVGVDVGRSRHDAMLLGEQGADYIGFGIPSHVADRETASARRHDLVEWWAEIFELPVVALDVETADEAARLAGAGADFIAIRIPGSVAAADVEGWIGKFAAALERTETVT